MCQQTRGLQGGRMVSGRDCPGYGTSLRSAQILPLRLVSLTDPPGVKAQPTPAGFPGRRDTGQRRRVVGRPEGGGCVCISHRPLLKTLPRF